MAFDPSERELIESLGIGTPGSPYADTSDFARQYQANFEANIDEAIRRRNEAQARMEGPGFFGSKIGRIASALAIPFAAPAVGGLAGLSGLAGGVAGGTALGAGTSALAGDDILRGAALGGLSGGLGSLGTAVPSESLVSAVPATIPETLAGAIQNPLLRGAAQGSLNAGAVAAASQLYDRPPNTPTPRYVPPGQGTVPERVIIEGRIPIPGPGMEDFPIVLGDVQDILDVIRGGGATPPTPQLPGGTPSAGPAAGEVLDLPPEVIDAILNRIPSGGGGGGAPQEPAPAPIPPVPGTSEPSPPPESAQLDSAPPPPGADQEPPPPGADQEPPPPGTQQPEPDLGSAMGLMSLLAQPGAQVTAETPEGADIRIYDLENMFGVSGLDRLYNAPFQDELTLITEELLKAARERR